MISLARSNVSLIPCVRIGPSSVSSTAPSGMFLVNALSIMLPTYSRRRRISPLAVAAVSPLASAVFLASAPANCCFNRGVSRETSDGICSKSLTTLSICALKCLISLSLSLAISLNRPSTGRESINSQTKGGLGLPVGNFSHLPSVSSYPSGALAGGFSLYARSVTAPRTILPARF